MVDIEQRTPRSYTRVKTSLWGGIKIVQSSGSGVPPEPPPEEPSPKWHSHPLVKLLLAILAGLIVAGLVYWFGWNP
jgi:hypothetical protein